MIIAPKETIFSYLINPNRMELFLFALSYFQWLHAVHHLCSSELRSYQQLCYMCQLLLAYSAYILLKKTTVGPLAIRTRLIAPSATHACCIVLNALHFLGSFILLQLVSLDNSGSPLFCCVHACKPAIIVLWSRWGCSNW